MKQMLNILIVTLSSFSGFGQIIYSGFIDKYPIEFITDIYSDGDARAIYAYSNFDEPIVVNGKLNKGALKLFEKGAKGVNKATLIFDRYDAKSGKLIGTWADLQTKKILPITLDKKIDLNSEKEIEGKEFEILQPVLMGNNYFKLIVSKKKDDFSLKVIGVKVLERKTDKLIQKIDLDCQLMGFNNISIGDFNFDGLTDFAVFESSYAGPNTSSLYFLYNPKTLQYFDSGFSGVSLEFDNTSKTILEHNQCCGGASHTTSVYKVVKNKMILTEQHCYKWDEKKQDLVERKMKECQ